MLNSFLKMKKFILSFILSSVLNFNDTNYHMVDTVHKHYIQYITDIVNTANNLYREGELEELFSLEYIDSYNISLEFDYTSERIFHKEKEEEEEKEEEVCEDTFL